MKLLVQRVSQASVTSVQSNKVAGSIEKGLFVLIGVKKNDTPLDASSLADKLVKLRILADQNDKMNLSLKEATGRVLVVSQFTLYANTKDGNRPSFIDAASGPEAKKLYEIFVNRLKEAGLNVQTGIFGNYMRIEATLDGPVTIVLES